MFFSCRHGPNLYSTTVDTVRTHLWPSLVLFRSRSALLGIFGGTFQGTSVRSFPSGHSSESMAGTLYVTLICWADLSRYPGAHEGWRRSLLVRAEAIIEILPFPLVYCNVLKDIFISFYSSAANHVFSVQSTYWHNACDARGFPHGDVDGFSPSPFRGQCNTA